MLSNKYTSKNRNAGSVESILYSNSPFMPESVSFAATVRTDVPPGLFSDRIKRNLML